MDASDRSTSAPGPSGAVERAPSTLELLVQTVSDYAIFALDVDGRVASWNAGAERLKGYQAAEIIGQHFSRFYGEEDRARRHPEHELSVAVASGRYEEEGWRVRKDGTRFWAHVVITALRGATGELVGFGKVTRDLTERKEAEDALRASEERFRLLVSSVTDYAIFSLTPEGTVATWNPGAERLKGYRAEEVVGRHLSTFYTPEDRAAGVPEVALATARAAGRWEHEGWRVRKDGSRFWANVVITPLRGATGDEVGFAKVTRDLTERKRSEDALRSILERERQAAAALRTADELRRDLVAMVAHDLRGPVAIVQQLLHLLEQDWEELEDADRREAIHRVRARAASLASLTDDVLDSALLDEGRLEVRREPIDLAAIAGEVVADARDAHPDRTVVLRSDGPVAAVGDRARTAQVVENLVSNAVKYSPAGSPVEVTVEEHREEATILVRDRGPGLTPDEQARIFERYARTEGARAVPGSGLGLFIARSLIEAQGGTISVSSTPGSGATFCVSLPRAGEPVR